MAANLNFLLLGEGNIPWMVKELVRHAAPDAERQPRILIGVNAGRDYAWENLKEL